MSNGEWVNPNDPEAEITRLKDGRTALAYKAEQAVDMQSGAIVAVTTHGGAASDTETMQQTVCEAGIAVAGLIAEKTPGGAFQVHTQGVKEVVADKGYHSNEVVRDLRDMEVRSYIAEPERGSRNWADKPAEEGRFTRTDDGLGVSGASACWPGVGNGSSVTLRISSTLVG
jgi:transposase